MTAEQGKGKMILIEDEPISLKDIRPTHIKKTIEVRVYRKWTATDVRTRTPEKYCCILLDKEGTAIQANMDLKEKPYFDERLHLNRAYRISHFICGETKRWQQTVPNKTTLTFGRHTSIDPIECELFPEHYFNFSAYNEVLGKATTKDPTMTDYIGCIHKISDLMVSGDVTRSRKTRLIIDIQNLDGINLPFFLWNEMAEQFDMQTYADLPKPVIIAVGSAWATTNYGRLELHASSPTHYYLNPDIPAKHYILDVYSDFIQPTESLNVRNQPFDTPDAERMRNRYSIQELLAVNPQHYERTRFTTEATITDVTGTYGWFYRKCTSCKKKVRDNTSECPDHGLQPINYGYCFRITISDGTATTTVVCFSPKSHTIVPDCNDMVHAMKGENRGVLPKPLSDLKNKRFIFQYRFGPKAQPGNPDFSLTAVFKISALPVLALPPPPIIDPTPQTPFPQADVLTPTPPTEIETQQQGTTTPAHELFQQPTVTAPTTTGPETIQHPDETIGTPHTLPKPNKPATKRELFKSTLPTEKKPRQED